MKRRQLLFGAVTTAAGVGLLTGSEGLTQGVSQRQVQVDVASDEDAYLGLELLETVTIDGEECETQVDLLTITNQSKLVLKAFQVEIDLGDADAFDITNISVPDELETGETDAVTVTIVSSGQETTTGTVTVTAESDGDDPGGVHGTEGRFELHRSWQISLEADCPIDPESPSFVAFCGTTDVDSDDVNVVYDDEGVWERVEWNSEIDPETVALYSGTGTAGFDEDKGEQSYLNYNIDEESHAHIGGEDQEAGQTPPPAADKTGQTPQCPCQNESDFPGTDDGVKFDIDDDGTVSGDDGSVC